MLSARTVPVKGGTDHRETKRHVIKKLQPWRRLILKSSESKHQTTIGKEGVEIENR